MTQLNKPYILLAEDNTTYGNAYLTKFRLEGFEVTWLPDGSKVIEYMQKRKPDLLLLDLVMPKKTGLAILEELKELPDLQSIPVIVGSNLSHNIGPDKIAQYDVFAYFVKSDISMNELVELIRKATNRA